MYQPGRAYHSTHEHRREGIEGRCGISQPGHRHEILSDLFPDLGEPSYEDWDYQQSDVLLALIKQRMLRPEETRHICKLDGPLETAPYDETPSMALLHMVHVSVLPPIWDLLDYAAAQALHLVEFTDLLNGCSPGALVWNAFVLLCMVATARYLHLKSQELYESLMTDHETIEFEVEEKVRLRGAAPAVDASAQPVTLLTDQLAAMSSKHQEALAAAASNAQRVKLAECAGLLRGKIGLAQQDLTWVRNDPTTALAQAHAQVADPSEILLGQSDLTSKQAGTLG